MSGTCDYCGLSTLGLPTYPGRDGDGALMAVCVDCALDDPDCLVDPGDAEAARGAYEALWDCAEGRKVLRQIDWLRKRVDRAVADAAIGGEGIAATSAMLTALLDLLDESYTSGHGSVTSGRVRRALHEAVAS